MAKAIFWFDQFTVLVLTSTENWLIFHSFGSLVTKYSHSVFTNDFFHNELLTKTLILTFPTVNGPTATHNSPHATDASTESTTSTTYRNFRRRTTAIPILDPPSTGIKGFFQSKPTSFDEKGVWKTPPRWPILGNLRLRKPRSPGKEWRALARRIPHLRLAHLQVAGL